MGEKKSEHEWINAAVQACIVVAVVFGVIAVIGFISADGYAYPLASVATAIFFWGFAGIISLVMSMARR